MLCAYASFIISSSLFKSCIIPVAWVCHPLRSMSITDTSDFCFPRSTNKPVLLSCHLYAACRNAIDRLLKRPSLISLAVTATSYMEGSQPFIYRCAPRGTRTCHCPAGIVKNIISNVFKKNWEGGTRTCPDDYFPSIIFTRSSNELRSRASTFISRILPCLSVILYVGNELIWR